MNLQATVIIPTFEDWGGLQICLDCLSRQSVDGRLFEVIVANNNPSPDLPASLRLPSNVRVIHVPKPGSYAARNAAILEARADVIFLTDSDCQPDSRWIEAGLAAIAPLGPHGRVAGHIQLFPKADHWTLPELHDRVHDMRQELYASKGWCATANLVARRAVFDLAGQFDADRFSLGDGEWGVRAADQGSPIVYSPDTLIRHPARASFAALAKKRRRVAGGLHQNEVEGRIPKRSMASLLSFLTSADIHTTMSFPGLTDWERMKIMGLRFSLGVVEFSETMRLRFFAGKPRRS